jgi:predicted MFS family arabinose efflux permease
MLSGIGFGALVGALLVASLSSARWRLPLLGTGVMLTAAALLCLAVVHGLFLAIVCCAVSGCGLILFFATGQAVMQLGSDDHNRGRIMGIWLMVLSGAHPLGHLLAGRAADTWGVPLVLALEGLGIALAAGLALLVAVVMRDRRVHGDPVQAEGKATGSY